MPWYPASDSPDLSGVPSCAPPRRRPRKIVDRTGCNLENSPTFMLKSCLFIAALKKVVEQADEALRLANARAEAGTGTQLDVLSADGAHRGALDPGSGVARS